MTRTTIFITVPGSPFSSTVRRDGYHHIGRRAEYAADNKFTENSGQMDRKWITFVKARILMIWYETRDKINYGM